MREFEYKRERNADLIRAYQQVVRTMPKNSSSLDIYREISKMPSSRFWVSPERAAIVVGKIMKGDDLSSMRPNKRKMFFEIYQRTMKLRERSLKATISELVLEVVSSPAPQFYLTPDSVKVIICKALKNRFSGR